MEENKITIKGVAFDLEGPLVDTDRYHFSGFFTVAKNLGLESLGFTDNPLSFEKIIPGAIGGGDLYIFENLLKLANKEITSENIEGAKALKVSNYHNMFTSTRLASRDGVREVVDYIKNRLNLPISIGSATPKEKAELLFYQSGVSGWFPKEKIVLRDDVKNPKPSPDVYFETARRMGIKTSEQLVFEDSIIGAEAAVASGSVVVAMSLYDMPYFREKFKALGVAKFFTSWSDPELFDFLSTLKK